ncbi:MAG: phosphomethylpyrimidine synthase ThiC, partial [Clostridia bacterium]|nr:phosphomethylpyrimidine synthase ThiC [Clostridia bacterium]
MNQMFAAWRNQVTPEMEQVARDEGRPVEYIMQAVGNGTVVIPANTKRENLKARGFGTGLRTKVNANIGTSSQLNSIEQELAKLKAAADAGADAVMDLSTGGDLDEVRRRILAETTLPLGTVPIYQATVEAKERRGSIVDMTADDLFEVIERQARDGVDFMTVHCGVTLESVGRLRRQGRVTDIVSRGGSFLTGWMLHHGQENPLFEEFDRLLDICLEYDVTLSLGDGLRPGSIADATDRAQIQELLILGELLDRCRETGVQAMVEGPGHVPLDQVIMNVQLQKRLCKGAPFYVLGPL